MKITICGSIAFYDKMQQIKRLLEKRGHQVKLPPVKTKDAHGQMIPVKQFLDG